MHYDTKNSNRFEENMHGLYGYLGKRILLAGLTLLIILFVSYLLLRIAP